MLKPRTEALGSVEAEAIAPPPPVESPIQPEQKPGFDKETADRFGVPPWKLPAAPAEDPAMDLPGPQLEVVIKIDTTAPGYLSA